MVTVMQNPYIWINEENKDADGVPEEVLFRSMSDGHLDCGECEQKVWCNHIALIVSKLGDSQQIFDESNPDDIDVMMPVFPSLNIFIGCELSRVGNIPGARLAMFDHAKLLTAVTLGYMHPGEGRNTLRSMFFDWFTAEFATTKFECPSGTHKPSQESRVRELMTNESGFLMTRVAIWSEGMCPPCIQSQTADVSDLVPDDERPNPWSKP